MDNNHPRKKKASVRRFFCLLAVDLLLLICLRGCMAWYDGHGESHNDQSYNDQSYDDQSYNDQSYNDQSYNDQSYNDQSYYDQPPVTETSSTTAPMQLPILMYHSVREGPESDYSVTPDTFARDLAYLYAHAYTAVSPEAIIAYVYAGAPLPERPVLLTFDDGFYNNLAYVLPLLEQYDAQACINIVGEFTTSLAIADSHIPAYSYLTPEDLQQLQASNRITIGNHTDRLHHRRTRIGCRILAGEREERYRALLAADVSALQAFCRETLQIAPIVFAYPYGCDCPESVPVLRELGFLMTLTCYAHSNPLTTDPNCLYNMGRWNRAGGESTASFFRRTLERDAAPVANQSSRTLR